MVGWRGWRVGPSVEFVIVSLPSVVSQASTDSLCSLVAAHAENETPASQHAVRDGHHRRWPHHSLADFFVRAPPHATGLDVQA